MRLESDNGQALIKELEQKRGGQIVWRAYSLYYADNYGKIIENGVLVYKIGDSIWLEDFEKTPSIFGIKISEPKNYRYEKFERCFQEEEIVDIQTVLKKDAKAFVEQGIAIKKANKIAAFFSEPLSMITLKDDSKIFLQMIDTSVFKKIRR